MPRLEVELTSARPDGSWTWRKAGARQPKGELDGALLPDGAKVGDVLRVEADALIDGIEITAVLPAKGERKERFERIELNARPEPDQLVSTTLSPKAKRRDRRGGNERPRRDRGERGDRGPDRRGGRARPAPLDLPERPRPRRLKAGRAHRVAVLDALPPEERPVAEQALQGGVPAVRRAVEQQNEELRAAGRPEVKGDELVALAEQLLPSLRAAEWRDRAEAAMAIVDEIDLRDLRSVVVAADAVRDDEGRALADQLREALGRRVEEEHEAWLEELRLTIKAERVVRALRVSSRPPKAGSPLPADLTQSLVAAATGALTAETAPERWSTVLDALATSPVRTAVQPASVPDPVPDALKEAVAPVADRLPDIAQRLGVDPAAAKPARRRRRRPAKGSPAGAGRSGAAPIPPPPDPPPSPEPPAGSETPSAEAPSGSADPE